MKATLRRSLAKIRAWVEEVVPDLLVYGWARLDPKLKYTVISGGISYVLGATFLNGPAGAVIAGAVASAVGYRVPNTGSLLRNPGLDNGNPTPQTGMPKFVVDEPDLVPEIDRSALDPTDPDFKPPPDEDSDQVTDR